MERLSFPFETEKKNGKLKYPFVVSGHNYALDVDSGKINVCVHVKNAVKKYLRELDKAYNDPDYKYYFDPSKAEKYLNLVQRFEHVKGANWKTPTITFEPWQNFLFSPLMGFMRKDTHRRKYRTAYTEIPRGQGKSLLGSQIGLYFLSLDGELGPEVICASTKKDAARIVFDSSRILALKNKAFIRSTGTHVEAHKILHPKSNGVMKPISSDSKSLDGLNPSLILGDETHEWRRKLYDVLDSSLTKRDDSLFFMISTAGFNTEEIGHELSQYTKKVLAGEVDDDTWYGLIYSIDDNDDWEDPAVWEKANPNFGVSVDPVNFEAKAKKAKETPASQNNFLVKHLNVWLNASSPFFSIDHWDKCADKNLDINKFKGKQCWVGLDVASKVDLCSVFYIFKQDGKYYLFDRSFIPEARIHDNRNVKYAEWVKNGYLNSMVGEVINFEILQNQIIEDSKLFRFIGLNFDPWNATETSQKLMNSKVECIEFRMSTGNLSEPMKKLDAEIRVGNIVHNGSPLLRWCLGNVVAKADHNDNVFPRKEHGRLKIDPIVASIMAMAGHLRDEQNESVYEKRSLIIV